nr:MAG TPA: hypothetical protein [Caudoviricetes sp.]
MIHILIYLIYNEYIKERMINEWNLKSISRS